MLQDLRANEKRTVDSEKEGKIRKKKWRPMRIHGGYVQAGVRLPEVVQPWEQTGRH